MICGYCSEEGKVQEGKFCTGDDDCESKNCLEDKNIKTTFGCHGKCLPPPVADGEECEYDKNCESNYCNCGVCGIGSKDAKCEKEDGCGPELICTSSHSVIKNCMGQCKDPCDGVVCHNGGECDMGKCTCELGYAGKSCDILQTGDHGDMVYTIPQLKRLGYTCVQGFTTGRNRGHIKYIGSQYSVNRCKEACFER